MKTIFRLCFALAAMAVTTFAAPVKAEAIRGLVHSLAPLNIENQPEQPGIAVELVQEMVSRANVDMELSWAPFSRNSVVIHNEPNGVIFPLAFSEKREPNFTWIAPLIEMNSIFVTTGDAVNSFDEGRALGRIAVQRGSILMRVLEDRGFDNLVEVDDHLMAARQLQAGRVDAWYSSDIPAVFALRNANMDLGVFTFGESTRKLDFRLGAHLEFDTATVSALQAAMQSMRDDGTVDKIITKYLG